MLVACCMPRKHRVSVTFFVKARVLVVLCGAVTTPAASPVSPLSSSDGSWQKLGGISVGRCGGGRLWGSLLICHRRLSQAQRGTSMSWEKNKTKQNEKENWKCFPLQSVCSPLAFSYLPCSKKTHFLYVRLQSSDNQLGANACSNGTRQERLEKCSSARLAPTPLKASPPHRHSAGRQRLIKGNDAHNAQRCREPWRGLQVGALRGRAWQYHWSPQRHKRNLAVPLSAAFTPRMTGIRSKAVTLNVSFQGKKHRKNFPTIAFS